MQQITNTTDVSLALAVWLVHDEYDYVDVENYISVTRLMKPIRHLVLPHRIPKEKREAPDVVDFIATQFGHSLHDSIEKAWTIGYENALAKLGYPEDVIARVIINPTPEQLAAKKNAIPIYLEQRKIRDFMGFKIGGKFDFVAEGIVQDFKSTTSYTWLYGGRDEEHRLQGSLYKWLNPDKITEDFIRINYIFTDWQKVMAKANPAYPQSRVQHKDIPLMTTAEVEAWIKHKLEQFNKFYSAPEPTVPPCTPEELWMSDPAFKYYADPAKVAAGGRSTKNFETLQEANAFKAEKGKGVVITVPGEAKRCGYCDAYDICTQKEKAIL